MYGIRLHGKNKGDEYYMMKKEEKIQKKMKKKERNRLATGSLL